MPDSSPPHDDTWDGSRDRVRAVLREWRDDHPRATFTEIEGVVRLGTWMPFDQVPGMLAFFTGCALMARRCAA